MAPTESSSLQGCVVSRVTAGLMSPSAFVSAVSTAVAHAFNLYPRKGVIAPGSDADLFVFDPSARHVISAATHHSRIDTNIYEGREVQGKVRAPVPCPVSVCTLIHMLQCTLPNVCMTRAAACHRQHC